MMLDGLELKGRMMIVALGITTEGVKIPLGLWEGSTENATVATALLSDLVERGLDPEQGMLFVIDGSKALRKAVRSVFGEVPVQRCLWHKERNVLGHLPERDRPPIKARMRRAWRETDYDRALEQLTSARRRARPHASRRRRLAAGGDGGDADRDPARDQGQAPPHAGVHQPVRVDDRHRPHHPAQRQALVLRRDGPALDRRRDARSREAVPQGHRLHASCPTSRSRSNADSTFPSPTPPQPRRPRSQSLCNDHTRTAVTEVPRRTGQPQVVAPFVRQRPGGYRRTSTAATKRRVLPHSAAIRATETAGCAGSRGRARFAR